MQDSNEDFLQCKEAIHQCDEWIGRLELYSSFLKEQLAITYEMFTQNMKDRAIGKVTSGTEAKRCSSSSRAGAAQKPEGPSSSQGAKRQKTGNISNPSEQPGCSDEFCTQVGTQTVDGERPYQILQMYWLL